MIRPSEAADGFGVQNIDLVALPGLPVHNPPTPSLVSSVAPPSTSPRTEFNLLLYILIGAGGLCYCLSVIGVVVLLVKKRRSGSSQREEDNNVSMQSMTYEPTPAVEQHSATPSGDGAGIYGSLVAPQTGDVNVYATSVSSSSRQSSNIYTPANAFLTQGAQSANAYSSAPLVDNRYDTTPALAEQVSQYEGLELAPQGYQPLPQ